VVIGIQRAVSTGLETACLLLAAFPAATVIMVGSGDDQAALDAAVAAGAQGFLRWEDLPHHPHEIGAGAGAGWARSGRARSGPAAVPERHPDHPFDHPCDPDHFADGGVDTSPGGRVHDRHPSRGRAGRGRAGGGRSGVVESVRPLGPSRPLSRREGQLLVAMSRGLANP